MYIFNEKYLINKIVLVIALYVTDDGVVVAD